MGGHGADFREDIWGQRPMFFVFVEEFFPKNAFFFYIIVACQRGGVSNKPPWLRAATRHGPGIL